MKKPYLSVCIPTYNRQALLACTLDSLVADSKNIEICVSDNASTDGTANMLETYKPKFDDFILNSWSKNVGPDLNYLKVIEIAQSEYCWLMGSDDASPVGAVDKIIAILKAETPDVLLFDRYDCDDNMRPREKKSWFIQKSITNWNLSDPTQMDNYFKSIKSLGGAFSYLSSIVVKRSSLVCLKQAEELNGTAYSHVGAIIKSAITSAKFKLTYLPEALVLNRCGNDSFRGKSYAKRYLLDIVSYRHIISWSGIPSDKRYWILQHLIKKEHFENMHLNSLKNAAWLKLFSTSSDWASLMREWSSLGRIRLAVHAVNLIPKKILQASRAIATIL
jgi:abequosyltransferase